MTVIVRYFAGAVLLFSVACASPPAVDKVPVGQDVTIVKADGGVVEGTVTSRDDKKIELTTGSTTKSVPRDQILEVRAIDNTKPSVLPPAAAFREHTVPEGTTLHLRLATSVSSETSRPNDLVEATLDKAVMVGGREVLPAGSTVKGMVSTVHGAGKVKGLASLTLHFTSVTAEGRDDRYEIDAPYSETAEATKRDDAVKIGIGAGAGAAIGGLLGGKSGAAKGTVIGGGAGTAAVLATKGREVEHRAGSTLSATLRKSVDVKIPIT